MSAGRALRLGHDDAEDFGADRGKDLRVQAAGSPLVQKDLRGYRRALTRYLPLASQLPKLAPEVVASPPSDE